MKLTKVTRPHSSSPITTPSKAASRSTKGETPYRNRQSTERLPNVLLHKHFYLPPDDKKSPTAVAAQSGGAQLRPIGPLLTSLVDVENVPLAVDLCTWIADITNSCIEIEQFFSCLQDGIVLCRLINAINRMKCEKSGDTFRQVHFRENIGNSVFFARINIETFIRWSKSFGVSDPISVSDLIDHRDPMKAIDNLYTIGRICREMNLSHPAVISLEEEHGYRYREIVALFASGSDSLNKQQKSAKDGLRNLINIRELGALRSDQNRNEEGSDVILSEQLANYRKKLTGKWTGKEIVPPTPEPLPPSPPPKEAKMGPWDKEEVDHLISLYREQIEEYGDDHIDFQRLSRKYTQRYQYRTPHQCWDKMYQLIERYQCDRNANRLFKRRVCSGPHHEQLHLCLGDTHIGKHMNAVYTGMVHPKIPTLPAYLEYWVAMATKLHSRDGDSVPTPSSLLAYIPPHTCVVSEASSDCSLFPRLSHLFSPCSPIFLRTLSSRPCKRPLSLFSISQALRELNARIVSQLFVDLTCVLSLLPPTPRIPPHHHPALLAGDPEERKEEERIGKEQLLEQTKLLRQINENLEVMRETAEKNAATNSALLCLLTHVLKGERDLEVELRGARSDQSSVQNGAADKMSPSDLDAKSLASDADIVPVDQPAC
eukprot:sb/3462826/